jgi:hypothetical protein
VLPELEAGPVPADGGGIFVAARQDVLVRTKGIFVAPGIFALADPDRIRELVTGAGFAEPQVEQVAVKWSYDTPEMHWEKTIKLAAPIAEAVNSVPEDEREAIRATVAERVEQQLADGAGVDGLVHVVTAR